MNLSQSFLSSYELCCKTASPEYCKGKIVDGAGFVVETYLSSYDFCKKLEDSKMLQSGDCLKSFSAEINVPALDAWIFAFGMIAGATLVSIFKR